MALNINLYHEIQTQSLQRKRDPFRLGMLVILMVALALLGYYFYRAGQLNEISTKESQLQAELLALKPKEAKAAEREKELRVSAKLSQTLMQSIEGRSLWGPILDMVVQAVPADVQIKSFEASKSLSMDKTKQLSFTLAGIASGPEARKAAEDFRMTFLRSLSENFKNVTSIPKDGFKSLEDREEKAILNGQTYPTAAFVVSYEASIDSPEATASPTPRVKRVIKK